MSLLVQMHFFPFGDNIERAHKSGVTYIAQPGGSVRDDNVIDACNKYNMAMCIYRYSSVPSLRKKNIEYQLGVNPPADIACGRIAEVRSRSMSCNCMTRTSQQECRGILELRRTLSEKCRFFGRCSFLYCNLMADEKLK